VKWLLAALLLLTACLSARAEEITVLSAGAINGVVKAVIPSFEAKSGDRVTLRNDTVGALVKRIQDGEAFDVVLMSPSGLQALGRAILPGSDVALASVGAGVGVRSGDPVPDIATPDAFRAAMLHARAVAYIDPASGGSSGIHVARLFGTLGIADAMARKSVLVHGGLAAEAVIDGRADIVIQQISEIMAVPGIKFVGPLPDAIQMRTVYAGAIAAASVHQAASRAFLVSIRQARDVMTQKGLTPP
jgi:molybdate transport system substrate-binding protein